MRLDGGTSETHLFPHNGNTIRNADKEEIVTSFLPFPWQDGGETMRVCVLNDKMKRMNCNWPNCKTHLGLKAGQLDQLEKGPANEIKKIPAGKSNGVG